MKFDDSLIESLTRDGYGDAYVYLDDVVACEPKLSDQQADAEKRAVAQLSSILSELSLPPAVKEIGYKRSYFRCERVTPRAVLLISEIPEVSSVIPPLLCAAA